MMVDDKIVNKNNLKKRIKVSSTLGFLIIVSLILMMLLDFKFNSLNSEYKECMASNKNKDEIISKDAISRVDYYSDSMLGGALWKEIYFKDYYTSCIPPSMEFYGDLKDIALLYSIFILPIIIISYISTKVYEIVKWYKSIKKNSNQ